MTSDEYIQSVLQKYNVQTGPGTPAYQARQGLNPLIEQWARDQLLEVKLSGSYVKGTAVRGRADVDLLISLDSNCSDTIEEIYNSLVIQVRNAGYTPRRQDVSIGLTYLGTEVDLVPAKKHSGNTNDHSLWRDRAKTWIKTNVDDHIRIVTKSNRIDEIKALKIWRQLHDLEFPSIYLELTTIEAVKGKPIGQVASNVYSAFQYLANSFMYARIVDPANTNNFISDTLSIMEKAQIVSQARSSLGKELNEIIW